MTKTAKVKGLLVAVFVVMALFATGCEQGTSKTEEKKTGYADILLAIDPDPAVALKPTRFIATVKGRDGAPVNGASVVFDLSMPGMYHGENRPVANETGPGVYEAEGILTMGGRWQIVVEVTGKDLSVKEKFYTDVKSK